MKQNEHDFLYDAFISYRHLPLDKAVAIRLQELLENYRPPKGTQITGTVKRVFRDRSELPTSGDLGANIHEALLKSRYLIVICTEKTKESVWCMEEIRQFKEAHHGKNDHILVILADGEPESAFPQELLHESCPVKQGNGTVLWKERQMEPLSADVRAKTIGQSLRLLKTEFLRVAAPLLGCGYDDLYRRHERRKKRRLITASGCTLAAVTSVLAVVSLFAWRTWRSEGNYRTMLAETYTGQAAGLAQAGKQQEALLYYARALQTDPGTQSAARAGAALLLEQNAWPYMTKEEEGAIFQETVVSGALSGHQGTILASGEEGACFLEQQRETLWICRSDETREEIPAEMGTFLGATKNGAYWSFCGESLLYFYETKTGNLTAIPRPSEINSGCDEPLLESVLTPLPAAFPAADHRALAVYGGYVYLYEEKDGQMAEAARVDLADVFPEEAENSNLDVDGALWISDDGSLAVVSSGFGTAIFDTETLMLKNAFSSYHYLLNDVAISHDNTYIAFVFGNTFGVSYSNAGGYLKICRQDGTVALETAVDPETAYQGAVFDEKNSDRLLAWSQDSLHFWDIQTQKEYAAALQTDTVTRAAFSPEAHCITYDGDQTLRYYNLAEWSLKADTEQNQEAPDEEAAAETGNGSDAFKEATANMRQLTSVGNGLTTAHTYSTVYLLDENGTVLDQRKIDSLIDELVYHAGENTLYLFLKRQPFLYRIRILTQQGRFDETVRLDTVGNIITGLYPLQDKAAALTGYNQVLLYNNTDTKPEITVQLKHSGVVQNMEEAGNGYLAVTIQTGTFTPDSYHLDGIRKLTELWDINTGIYLAELEPEHISLPKQFMPIPDEEAAAFLYALTCCDFDDSQNVVTKQPELHADAMGSWEGWLYCPETASQQETPPDTAIELQQDLTSGNTEQSPPSGESQQELPSGESQQELPSGNTGQNAGIPDETFPGGQNDAQTNADTDSTEQNREQRDLTLILDEYEERAAAGVQTDWFTECDEIWAALCSNEIIYTAAALDRWFFLYIDTAQQNGYLERLKAGVQSYISINQSRIAGEEDWTGMFNYYLINLLTRTDSYDALIASFFSDLSEQLAENLDPEDEFMDAQYYTICWLACYGNLIEGKESEAFRKLDEAKKEGRLPDTLSADLEALKLLYEKDAVRAAEVTENYLEFWWNSGLDDTTMILLEQTALESYYALQQRGYLQEEILQQYLALFPADLGLRVTEVSPKALQAGIKDQDLITALDNTLFSCHQNALDAFGDKEKRTMKIIRDGKTVYVDRQEEALFGASFEILFQKKQASSF